MNRTVWSVLVILLGGIGAAYYYVWQQGREAPAPTPAPPTQLRAPISPPALTAPTRYPIEAAAPADKGLPPLDQSDAALLEALASALPRSRWLAILAGDGLIRRIVATVDSLPRERVAVKLMPVKSVPGIFIVAGKGPDLAIGSANAARYAPYVNVAQAVDAHKLVAVYRLFYPLFQQAYRELGYPDAYFNDRLVVAIDDLLAAPADPEPLALVQPKVLYEFADRDLDARSAGQKIMMRMGSENAARAKEALRAIRSELMRRASGQ